jgi:hypothetical protein
MSYLLATVQARRQPLVHTDISASKGEALTAFDRVTAEGHHRGIRSNANLALFRYFGKLPTSRDH